MRGEEKSDKAPSRLVCGQLLELGWLGGQFTPPGGWEGLRGERGK